MIKDTKKAEKPALALERIIHEKSAEAVKAIIAVPPQK
ncbi:hypothetical protein HJ01_00934 [Flavobacterium frigoris PS1]|uniref:Uncharacterized protein n=1 Tax=Flavobacterium frigoris (strain PS1) TaxID=1086011 RepID=H7FP36_FLAFP|nr:hypothetical protein HJ01_00934 [Flavobacterium frigoris PS1]